MMPLSGLRSAFRRFRPRQAPGAHRAFLHRVLRTPDSAFPVRLRSFSASRSLVLFAEVRVHADLHALHMRASPFGREAQRWNPEGGFTAPHFGQRTADGSPTCSRALNSAARSRRQQARSGASAFILAAMHGLQYEVLPSPRAALRWNPARGFVPPQAGQCFSAVIAPRAFRRAAGPVRRPAPRRTGSPLHLSFPPRPGCGRGARKPGVRRAAQPRRLQFFAAFRVAATPAHSSGVSSAIVSA